MIHILLFFVEHQSDPLLFSNKPPIKSSFKTGCSVKITGDLGEPQPLILNPTTNNFLYPEHDNVGVLTFNTNQRVDLFCSNGFSSPSYSGKRLSAYCESGLDFTIQSGVKKFSEITCNAYPYHSVRKTGDTCANGQGILLQVGFDIDTDFISYMDLCHDEVNEVSLYSHIPISALNYGYQSGFARPSFMSTGFFNGKYVDNLYTNVNQVAMGTKILGSEEQALKFFQPVATDKYLARGHLTAKVEVIYGSQQRGTFWFMNAAPQFQAFNGGNWESVESSTRRLMKDRKIVNGELYTGTHGILTLPDVNNVQQQIFLYFDENNNGLIPVPALYYKIIIDKDTKSGIAIIGVNNIYLTEEEVRQHIHCTDISDQIDWITWTKSNINLGYCYACEVNEFLEFLGEGALPDLGVENVLL